ncbi:MAG: hypothetical protein KA734_03730 [Fluviicola sp.]|nr:hypothetical protein [Fluviicola sp.]MBP6272052.1 hypothetical protein [Fluviicola sp.]
MKKWMFAAFALLVFTTFTACSKYTTPKKVSRKVVGDAWVIKSLSLANDTLTSVDFVGFEFSFEEDNDFKVTYLTLPLAEGKWSTALDKDPAILYLNLPIEPTVDFLSDDWKVMQIKKDFMRLERNDNAEVKDIIEFTR